MLDFIRMACAVPRVQVGNTAHNAREICRFIAQADEKQVDVLILPELCLTGCSCGDLFFDRRLLQGEREGLNTVLGCSRAHPLVTVVLGLTVTLCDQLYSCAAVISGGEVHGIVPKTFLNDRECRCFSSAADTPHTTITGTQLGLEVDYSIDFGRDVIFTLAGGVKLGVELGDDLQAPLPPSTLLTMQGAQVIVNPASSVQTVGQSARRREEICQASARGRCIYAYASAGCTESTQDVVYSGHSLIAACGTLLAENDQPAQTDYMLVMDADLGPVQAGRVRDRRWRQCAGLYADPARQVECRFSNDTRGDGSLAHLNRLPFVPETEKERQAYCLEVFQLQVAGLKQRLSTIGVNAVIGVSGGLDSTLALLVCAEAMRQLGRPVSDVYGVTMPCFGTSERTHDNSLTLMKKLGITSREIPIRSAVSGHFSDIGHDPSVHNATYENAQARERTQVLMDYASTVGGIVIGTGDLSELALGWCTFNGDHMSMYGVNGSVPKTLIRWMIQAIAQLPAFVDAKAVLEDILDTPISPELLPPDAQGRIAQQTEDIVGPYALHDFFLYYLLGFGYSPRKIYTLACRAFVGDFTPETVKKWLTAFYRRFFTQQFKRNCQPDGVKALPLGLGPRGDWNMPSDAACRLWMEEIEAL